jgi:hypothetical protein
MHVFKLKGVFNPILRLGFSFQNTNLVHGYATDIIIFYIKERIYDIKDMISSTKENKYLSIRNILTISTLSLLVVLVSNTIDKPIFLQSVNAVKNFDIDVSIDKDEIRPGDTQHITVTAFNDNTGNIVPNADVKLTVYPPHSESTSAEDDTDENGDASFNVKIDDSAETGTYDVDIRVSKDGYHTKTVNTSFEVVGSNDDNNGNDDGNDDGSSSSSSAAAVSASVASSGNSGSSSGSSAASSASSSNYDNNNNYDEDSSSAAAAVGDAAAAAAAASGASSASAAAAGDAAAAAAASGEDAASAAAAAASENGGSSAAAAAAGDAAAAAASSAASSNDNNDEDSSSSAAAASSYGDEEND